MVLVVIQDQSNVRAADALYLRLSETIIRRKTSGEYLGANGSWTKEPAQALGFADVLAVISAVQVHKLAGVEMVISAQRFSAGRNGMAL